MSMLLVGDPHVTVAELEDARALVDKIVTTPATSVVIMGDLFHTHSVVQLQVIQFWRQAIKDMAASGKVVHTIVGNHDMDTSGAGISALEVIRDVAPGYIVDRPHVLSMGPRHTVVAMPYCHDHGAFDRMQKQALELSQQYRARPEHELILLCHQTFAGAQYENGFYAPDGFPVERLVFDHVYSGHIHSKQTIRAGSKVIEYVGSPRWRTRSDANESKGLLLLKDDGTEETIDTSTCCRPLEFLEDGQTRRWDHSKLTVVVRGAPEAVRTRAEELQAQGIAVLPRPTVQAAPRISESRQTVDTAFQAFLQAFRAPHGTPGTRLQELAS